MNTGHERRCDRSDEVLTRAIQATLAEESPEDVKQRVIETAALWMKTSTSPHPQQLQEIASPRPLKGIRSLRTSLVRGHRVWWVFATAAALAAAATIFPLLSPTEGWAEVRGALRGKPWILGKYTLPDGSRHEDWISLPRGVSAMRHGDTVQFFDHRLSVSYHFDAKRNTLTRMPAADASEKMALERSIDGILQQIILGDEKLRFAVPGIEVVDEKRQSVARHGRVWRSHELGLRKLGDAAGNKESVIRITLLVDPQTRLPHILVLSDARTGLPSVELELSYPDTGPVDIYDLGVPRAATLVDLVPNGDLQRLIAGIRASADRFDDHVAINTVSVGDAAWYGGEAFAVFRKGACWRQVAAVVDSDAPPVSVQPDANPHEWWKSRWKNVFHYPQEVCDGATWWRNEVRPPVMNDQAEARLRKRSEWPTPVWKSQPRESGSRPRTSPLYIAYPVDEIAQVGRPGVVAEVDDRPEDGPADTVLLTLWSDAHSQWRFWIDPKRSYMVVRYEMLTSTPALDSFHQIVTIEESNRSPCGIWYPTVMRHTHVSEEKGKRTIIENVTRHYLEFNVEFSGDMFKPVNRPGEPLW